jgi:ribosome-associated translation inhibitor RaiA
MKLRVSSQNQLVTERLRDLIERRVRFALGRFESRIRETSVRLTDLNGPKGGIDKRCTIVVQLRGGSSVVASVSDVEFEPVIHRAADRIARIVGRRWDIARTRARYAADDFKLETGVDA